MSELPPLSAAVPLAAFRAAHGLDERFSVPGLFPKDFEGLGDAAGVTFGDFLAPLTACLQALPALRDAAALHSAAQATINTFEQTLHQLNARVGLSAEQADFAVAGFADLLWRCVYALLDTRQPPDFAAQVEQCIAESLHRSSAFRTVTTAAGTWQVATVSTLYGRVGLLVARDGQRWLVRDEAYTCPMAQVMNRLVLAAARQLQARYTPHYNAHPHQEDP